METRKVIGQAKHFEGRERTQEILREFGWFEFLDVPGESAPYGLSAQFWDHTLEHVVGGLWERVRTSSFRGIDALVEHVEAHRARGLTESERDAFRLVVELHRTTRSSNPLARQVRGAWFALRHRDRLRVLEEVLRPGPGS